MTEIERIASAFEELDISSHDPKWSSWLLDRMFDSALGDGRSTIPDILRGFDLALKRNNVHLTDTVANLIVSVIRTGLVHQKDFFRQVNWEWTRDEFAQGITPARAYLFQRCVPPGQLAPASVLTILRALKETPYLDEALAALGDDFQRPDLHHELQEWRSNGMGTEVAGKIDALLQNH